MRRVTISLRASSAQRDLIDKAARLRGTGRSAFVLQAASEKAQSVLLDQVFFRLNTEKFQQFAALLDAPPASDTGLHRLMAVRGPGK
jgi:uncharacterized protein (DUF1778 family)